MSDFCHYQCLPLEEFPCEFVLENHRTYSPWVKLQGIEDHLLKYFVTSKFGGPKLGANWLSKKRAKSGIRLFIHIVPGMLNQKILISRSSDGVGRKAGDFLLRNSCCNAIATGFRTAEGLQILELAPTSGFSVGIVLGPAQSPQPTNDLEADPHHKIHLSRSSGGVGWQVGDF